MTVAASLREEIRVGRYALYNAIAAGGMATVHLARMLGTAGFSKTVAIKRLHPNLAADPEFRSMFLDEARLASRIQHTNVVQPLDILATGAELFLVMDYVHGESLLGLVRSCKALGERVPLPIAAVTISNALHGLHAAHSAVGEDGVALGIVHRDISPHNILVGADGMARIIDFGVAKADKRSTTTRDGQLKGKMAYMAPEQLQELEVGPFSDVYAMGVVLWELTCGQKLFAAEEPVANYMRIIQGDIPLPSTVVPEISPGLDAIIMKSVAKNPADRFASAREMAIAMEANLLLAPASQVGNWVARVAADSLAKRSELLAAMGRLTATDELEIEEEVDAPRPSLRGPPTSIARRLPPPPASLRPSARAPLEMPFANTQRDVAIVPPVPELVPTSPRKFADTLPAQELQPARRVDLRQPERVQLPARGALSVPPPMQPDPDNTPVSNARIVPGLGNYGQTTLPPPADPRAIALDGWGPQTPRQGPPDATMQVQTPQPVAAKLPAKRRSGGLLSLFGLLFIALVVAWLASPSLLRRYVISEAAARGVTLAVGDVDVGLPDLQFHQISATAKELPGMRADCDSIRAHVSMRGIDLVTLERPAVEITGAFADMEERLALFQKAHPMQMTAASLSKIESKNMRLKWTDFAGPKTELVDSGMALALPQKLGTPIWSAASVTMSSARITSSGQSYGPYRLEVQRQADGTHLHIGFDPSGALVASAEGQLDDNGSKTLTLDIARSHLNSLGVRNGFGLVPANTAFELHAKLRAPADKKISYTLELVADLPDVSALSELTTYRWTATTETASHVPSAVLKHGSALVPFELAVSWTNAFKLLVTNPKGDSRIRLDGQNIALGEFCVRSKAPCDQGKAP